MQFKYNLDIIKCLEDLNLRSLSVSTDSRLVQSGDVFLAFMGEVADGRSFISHAIQNGACCVLWDSSDDFIWQDEWDVTNCAIPNLRQNAGEVAAWFNEYPSEKMDIIGVTGTNGKTSISQWLAQAFSLLDESCAIIGTVGNGFYEHLESTIFTTPDAVSLQGLLKKYHNEGAQAISMEVSSHGLSQYRADGVAFDGAIFTNLTRDHLDYHGNFDAYGEAKMRLFLMPTVRYVVINIDDPFGIKIIERLKQERPNIIVYTYGFSRDADIIIHEFEGSSQGMNVAFHTPWGECLIQTSLLGRFNAQNLAATLGVLCAQGYALDKVATVLSKIKPATGRMDCIIQENKPLVVVDYAHTPDALEKALTTLQEIKPKDGHLWCVFGCGGNRDKGKRPLMGAVAQQFADCPVVTSDNPRLESPEAIIQDILPAVPNPSYVEQDRQMAIEYAIEHANIKDIVLIAGKGHETYQDVAGEKHHFSDFEIAQTALERMNYVI